jgi:hypothetical protein
MKKINLSRLSLEELRTRQKWFRIIVYLLGILTVLALMEFAYYMFKQNSRSSSMPLGALSPILLFSSIYLGQIDTEIKTRNSQ